MAKTLPPPPPPPISFLTWRHLSSNTGRVTSPRELCFASKDATLSAALRWVRCRHFVLMPSTVIRKEKRNLFVTSKSCILFSVFRWPARMQTCVRTECVWCSAQCIHTWGYYLCAKSQQTETRGGRGRGRGGVIVVRSHRSVIPHYIRNTCSAGKRLPLMWSRARKVAVAMRSRRKLLIMHTRNLRGFVWLLATEPGAKMRLQQLSHVEKKTSQGPPNCFPSKLLLPAPVQL